MNKKVLVVGDIHLREKYPYYQQGLKFLDWLFTSEHNNENTTLVLLGDLVEKINATHELMEIYVDYFINKSKFSSIKILKGNHDCAILKDSNENVTHTTVLSIFRPLPNVEVIEDWKVDSIEGLKLLYLPHYDSESSNKEPMVDVYSNLKIDETIDYCFHHVEDHTSHFGSKFCDLSNLKVNNYLCGHIHTETLTQKGNYLGSPIYNSSNEKGKTPYIALIDVATKKYELIKVPIWVEYIDIMYPNELIASDKDFPIYTIHGSINKEETLKYYQEQSKALGKQFYCRRVLSKEIKSNELNTNDEDAIIYKSVEQHFEEYKKLNNLNDDIANICLQIISKRKED